VPPRRDAASRDAGRARHAADLEPLPVSKIASAFADDGAPLDPSWDKRFEKFAKELEWYANALREARAKGTPY